MAFGKLTKEDLKEAGLDPELLTKLQSEGVTKGDLATLKTELATSVTDMIRDQFKELEGKLTTKVPDKTTGGGNGGGNGDNTRTTPPTPEEEMQDYLSDPTGFISKKVNNVGIGAALEFKKMSRELAYGSLSTSLRGFKNPALKEEIDKEWEKYTPEVFVRNGGDPAAVLKQVHDMVMGKHYDDIQRDSDKKEGKYNLVSSGSGGGSSTGGFNNGNGGGEDKKTLTVAEKELAAKFGMTEAEWLQQEKDMEAEELTRRKLQPVA